MKLQHLDLGKGTSQHVLISGKTGSGKSTLLHVLITNLALRYSPDEIALYLVDFKKGVEFKAYARHALPHARVIAVESEREFGLSVLQHLDGELRRRGDLFRKLGVQDLKGYRTAPARGHAPAHPPDRRRVPGTVRRRRPHRPGGGLAAGPAGAARPGLRHPRAAGLANPGRGLFARPQHHRPNGGADRLAVQRGRRPPDPQRGEHGGAAVDPPRRGDLQRRQRRLRGQSSLPGGLASRRPSATTISAASPSWPRGGSMPARGRSSSRATCSPTRARTRSCTTFSRRRAGRRRPVPRGRGSARPWPSPSPPRRPFSARAAAICSWPGIAKRPPWA